MIGFEMPGVFAIGRGLGISDRVMAELIPAVEAGLVTGMNRLLEGQRRGR